MALRRLVGISLQDILDPWRLAAEVGLKVVDPREFVQGLEPEEGSYMTSSGSNGWSGGVYPKPLPNGMCLCFLNPWHSRRRNKVTLMEEVCHIHLCHKPTKLVLSGDGLLVRDYDGGQEEEAYGIGAAALVPWGTLFPRLKSGATLGCLAEDYDVTTDLIVYRIKITGAYRLHIARQRG